MMSNRIMRFGCVLVIPVLLLGAFGGCGSNRTGLPDGVTVELPDGTTTEATLGSGVQSLANTKWQFYPTSGTAQSAAFLTLSFGPEGNLDAFENNTIASDIFGETIYFDGQRHSTSQMGLQYAAATYGAETSDSAGFSFEARVTAFAAGIQAASANATASGVFDPDDPDVMTGNFSFSSRVTLLDMPEGNIDMDFLFVGYRIVEE